MFANIVLADEINRASPKTQSALLETYDGVSWSTEQALAPTGPVIEGPEVDWPLTEECVRVIPAAGFTGPLLPVPTSVHRVDGLLITASGAGGMVASARPGPVPPYRACGGSLSQPAAQAVSAGLDTATFSRLGPDVGSALPTSGPPAVRTINAESVEGLRTYLDKVTADAPPMTRLQEAARFLRSDRYAVATAAGGEAPAAAGTGTEYSPQLVSVQRLLAAGLGPTPPRARAELYPQAFAVLARVMGVPSRVVVGYDARRSPVGTADALVWPEVWVDGAGWLAFDVTPSRAGAGTRSFRDDVVAADAAMDLPPNKTVPVPVAGPERAVADQSSRARLIAATGAVLLIGWPFVLAGYRAARRRRLHRGDDPRTRVAGMWRSLMIDLRDAGVHVPPERPPTAWARHRPGQGEPLRELGRIVDLALYSEEAPTAGADARALATLVRRGAVRELRWQDRLVHAVRPLPTHGCPGDDVDA